MVTIVHLYLHIHPLKDCHTCILLDNLPIIFPISTNSDEEYDIEIEKGKHYLQVIHFYGNDFTKNSAVGNTNFKCLTINPKNRLGNHLIAWSNDIMLNKWTGNIIIQKDTDISISYYPKLYINFLNVSGSKAEINYYSKKDINLCSFTSQIGWTKKQKRVYFLLQLFRCLLVYGISILIIVFWLIHYANSWDVVFARSMTGGDVTLMTCPWLILLIVNLVRYLIKLKNEEKRLN